MIKRLSDDEAWALLRAGRLARLGCIADDSPYVVPVNYAADGGLYAELVQNRSFEYGPADRPEWHSLTAWELLERDGAAERDAWPPAGAKRVSHIPDPNVGADRRRPEAAPLKQPLHVPLPLTLTAPRDCSRSPPVRRCRALREACGVAVVPKEVRIEPQSIRTQRYRAEGAPGVPSRIPDIRE